MNIVLFVDVGRYTSKKESRRVVRQVRRLYRTLLRQLQFLSAVQTVDGPLDFVPVPNSSGTLLLWFQARSEHWQQDQFERVIERIVRDFDMTIANYSVSREVDSSP